MCRACVVYMLDTNTCQTWRHRQNEVFVLHSKWKNHNGALNSATSYLCYLVSSSLMSMIPYLIASCNVTLLTINPR